MKISCLRTSTLFVTAAIVASAFWGACSSKKESGRVTEGTVAQRLNDTLRVGTLYSPVSYFLYRGDSMGYDYQLIRQFADDKGLVLDLRVATSLNNALEMLRGGEVDILACEIPEIIEYKDNVVPCGPRSENHQVLVQPKVSGQTIINDVTDLPGHEVVVEDNTKYLYRLENLNEELGGGIDIRTIETDTIIADDLFAMVADGRIPLTVVDNDVAMINSSYYPTVDVSVEVSFHQSSAWGVNPEYKWLADSVDTWLNTDQGRHENSELYKRYFEQSRSYADIPHLDLSDGVISPYDDLFKKYAPEIGWDWRLLAAISLQESRFNPNAKSWAGARGLMQIMPKIGRYYGVDVKQLNDPETAVKTAVKLLGDIDRQLRDKIPDDRERIKFILACYNGGIGHVSDARALAEKYGYDPMVWNDNVERAVLMKSDRRYYNDPVVKYGYMRGRETSGYVDHIMGYYDTFRVHIPA